MKFIFILLIFFYCYNYSFAQKHDYIWHFGYKSGMSPAFVMDFNYPNDSIYVIPRQIRIGSDNASFCDADGKMFCYTNGISIQDSSHQTMFNGAGLNPGSVAMNNMNYGYPMVEGTIFIPVPARDSLIKLFHIGIINGGFQGHFYDKLYVTTINAKGNGGKGAVVSKNILLVQDSLFSELEAVKHGNGQDWWIVVPAAFSGGYYRFLLTSDSLLGPYYQPIGIPFSTYNPGQAVFSPSGTKYARYTPLSDLDIFDFDRCTGLLSNYIHIPIADAADNGGGGGVAFSPSSRYLYVSSTTMIYQYDMWASNIPASKDTVAIYDGFYYLDPSLGTTFFLAQLAPNGKIYLNCTNGIPFKHVMHYPDSAGTACFVEQHGIEFPFDDDITLPNFPHYRMGALPDSCSGVVAVVDIERREDVFKVYPNPTGDILVFEWEVNDKNNNAKIIMYNALGQAVQEISLLGNTGQAQISVQDLPIGIYFCKLYANGEMVGNQKIVIAR